MKTLTMTKLAMRHFQRRDKRNTTQRMSTKKTDLEQKLMDNERKMRDEMAIELEKEKLIFEQKIKKMKSRNGSRC